MKKLLLLVFILYCTQLNAQTETFYYQNKHISVVDAGAQQHDFIREKQTVFADMDTKETYMTDGKNIAFTLGSERQIHSVDYDPYGESGYAHSLFSYNQTYQDPTIALLYLHARDYAPSDERFISMDSYAVWNKYNFADANPIMKIDPSGHLSKTVKRWLLASALIAFGITEMAVGKHIYDFGEEVKQVARVNDDLNGVLEAKGIKRSARLVQLSSLAAVTAGVGMGFNNTSVVSWSVATSGLLLTMGAIHYAQSVWCPCISLNVVEGQRLPRRLPVVQNVAGFNHRLANAFLQIAEDAVGDAGAGIQYPNDFMPFQGVGHRLGDYDDEAIKNAGEYRLGGDQ